MNQIINNLAIRCAYVVCMFICCASFVNAESETSNKLSSEEAISRAELYVGRSTVSEKESAEWVVESEITSLVDSTTPFIGNQLNRERVWQVTFKGVLIDYWRGLPEQKYDNPKDIWADMDVSTGQLLKIVMRTQGLSEEDLSVKATAKSAEDQMRRSAEIYTGLLEEPPGITFLKVMDSLHRNPLLAREIVALPVYLSHLSEAPRPAWDIHLYGTSPTIVHGGGDVVIPLRYRTHMRYVHDANTGKVWLGSNLPQPE